MACFVHVGHIPPFDVEDVRNWLLAPVMQVDISSRLWPLTRGGTGLKLLGGIMLSVLQVITVVFVVVSFALSLAHALELPGKMRLDRETYYAVQPIYYPGFTIGGISEPISIILTIVLLVLTPRETYNAVPVSGALRNAYRGYVEVRFRLNGRDRVLRWRDSVVGGVHR